VLKRRCAEGAAVGDSEKCLVSNGLTSIGQSSSLKPCLALVWSHGRRVLLGRKDCTTDLRAFWSFLLFFLHVLFYLRGKQPSASCKGAGTASCTDVGTNKNPK
jgi:hypothetical protein